MKKTSLNPIKHFFNPPINKAVLPSSFIEKANTNSTPVLDREALTKLSQQSYTNQETTAEQHFLNQSQAVANQALTSTYKLMKTGLKPSKNYLINQIQGLDNSKFRGTLLSFLAPATGIFGLLEIIKGIRGAIHKSRSSTGAALTTGIAAISLSKIFKQLATHGGFQNLKDMSKRTNAIRNHAALILLLTIYQQFRTGHGFFQQFFGNDFKRDTVGLFNGFKALNPLNMLKGAVDGPFKGDSVYSLSPNHLEELVESSREPIKADLTDGQSVYT